ncbi:hypothetical protein [Streptomyces sp. NPDC001089]
MKLLERDPIVSAALLRTQRFMDDANAAWAEVKAQGKNPHRSKRVSTANAEASGALTVLAHVLGAAGADVLIDGLPSHTLANAYLDEWDKQRHAEAFRRATQGGTP